MDKKESLKIVELKKSRYPDAVYNDGSAAAYYFKENPGNNVWLVHLEGAGWCWDVEAYSDEENHWNCFMAECRAPLTQQPFLLIASQYDSALLKKNLGQHNFMSIPGLWKSFYEPRYSSWQLYYVNMVSVAFFLSFSFFIYPHRHALTLASFLRNCDVCACVW